MADLPNVDTPAITEVLSSTLFQLELAREPFPVGTVVVGTNIVEVPGPPTYEPELPPIQKSPTKINAYDKVIVSLAANVLTTSGFGASNVSNTNANVTTTPAGTLVDLSVTSSYSVTSVNGGYLNADVSVDYEIKSQYQYDLVNVKYFYLRLFNSSQSIEIGRSYQTGLGHIVYAEYTLDGQIVGYNRIISDSARGRFKIVRYGGSWAAAVDGQLLLNVLDLSTTVCEVTYGCESFQSDARILISDFRSEPGVAFGPYLMVNKVDVQLSRINGYIPYGSGGPYDVYIFDKSGNLGRVLSGVVYNPNAGQEITSKSGISGSILGDPSLR